MASISAKRKVRSKGIRKVTDSRFLEVCINNLNYYPVGECKQGKKRVQWMLKNKHASAEREASAPGCPYGVKSKEASYCMFKFLSNQTYARVEYPVVSNREDRGNMSYYQIAEATGLSVFQVISAEMSAVEKLRKIPEMADLLNESMNSRMYDKINYYEDSWKGSGSMDGFYLDLRDFDIDALIELSDEGYCRISGEIVERTVPPNIT